MVDIFQHYVVVVEDKKFVILRERECAKLCKGTTRPFGSPLRHYHGWSVTREEGNVESSAKLGFDVWVALARRQNMDWHCRAYRTQREEQAHELTHGSTIATA